MRNTISKFAAGSVVAACMFGFQAMAADYTLSDFFTAAASYTPNKLKASVFAEVGYDDNIHNAVHKYERDSLYLKAGVSADIYRTKGDISYGLLGQVSFDYYDHDAHDMNQFEWSLAPHLLGKFEVLGNDTLMISLRSRNKKEKIDAADTRYARKMVNGISLAYDINPHDKFGLAIDSSYDNTYYSQKEFKDHNKQDFDVAATPYYKISEKVKAGVSVGYSTTVYDKHDTYSDSKMLTIMGMVDYRMTDMFGINVKAGAQKKYMAGRARDCRYDRDFKPAATIALRYLPNKSMVTELRSHYGLDDGCSSRGIRTVWENSLGMIWSITEKITLAPRTGYYIHDEKERVADGLDTAEFFISTTAEYKFNEHFLTYLTYKYNNTQYKYDDDRDYDVNEVKFGVKYTF